MNNLIGYGIYIIFIVGLFFVIKPAIDRMVVEAKAELNISREYVGRRYKNKEKKKKDDSLTRHISKLLVAATGEDNKLYTVYFVLSSLLISILGVIITSRVLSITASLIISLALLFLPYVFLRIKLQNSRINASYEGDILVGALLNNYKICYFNMEEAIMKTAIEIENAPVSKKILFNLAKGLNVAATKEEVRELLDVFRFSISTSWGNILATNIYFACSSGIKVTNSLQDLSDNIIKARRITEYTKRENNEARLILKYLAPVAYLLTVTGAIKYFGFTLKKFFEYQFRTVSGLSWFIAIVITYVIGIAVAAFLTRKKMEL